MHAPPPPPTHPHTHTPTPKHPTPTPGAPCALQALLLTEHLLRNSSQHVVQVILEAAQGGVLEGLKQFKYLDEKNKDQGINVSGGGTAQPGSQPPRHSSGGGQMPWRLAAAQCYCLHRYAPAPVRLQNIWFPLCPLCLLCLVQLSNRAKELGLLLDNPDRIRWVGGWVGG